MPRMIHRDKYVIERGKPRPGETCEDHSRCCEPLWVDDGLPVWPGIDILTPDGLDPDILQPMIRSMTACVYVSGGLCDGCNAEAAAVVVVRQAGHITSGRLPRCALHLPPGL